MWHELQQAFGTDLDGLAHPSPSHSNAGGLAASATTCVDRDRLSGASAGASYSARSALSGSTWAARRAGIHVAAATTKSSATGMTTNAMGSAVVAPYTTAPTAGLATTPIATPRTAPTSAKPRL